MKNRFWLNPAIPIQPQIARRLRFSRAFTLIELLTVVSIIAILAALIFPLIGQLRRSAQGAVCLGNLRQISVAVANYTSENRGYIPPVMTDMRDEDGKVVYTRWWVELKPYLKFKSLVWEANWRSNPLPTGDEKVYLCPANPRKGNRGGAWVNYTGVVDASGTTYLPTVKETRRHFASFRSPLSQLPYIMDGYAGDLYSIIHPDAVDLFATIASAQSKVNLQSPQDGVFKPVHGNNINILYLDGHVATSDIRAFAKETFDYSRP